MVDCVYYEQMNEKAADPKTFNTKALRDKTKGIVPKMVHLSLLLFHSEIHIENQEIVELLTTKN